MKSEKKYEKISIIRCSWNNTIMMRSEEGGKIEIVGDNKYG